MDELRALDTVLTALQNFVGSNPQSVATLYQLNANGGSLPVCLQNLKQLLLKIEPKSGFRGVWNNLKWPLKEKETLQHISMIERHKAIFALALNVDHVVLSKTIEGYVQDTARVVQGIQTSILDTSTIVQGMKLDLQHTNTAIQGIQTNSQDTNAVMQEVKLDVQNTNSSVHEIKAHSMAWRQEEDIRLTVEKRKNILNWIYPGRFDEKHIDISDKRREGTGNRLLKTPQMSDWVKGGLANPRLLWGYGIPGAGKTFLSSIIINYLKDQAQTNNHGVAYIYFEYNEQSQQKLREILSSLVKQLANQTTQLSGELVNLYDELGNKGEKPTISNLYTLLLAVLKSFSRTYLVFDALDECDPNTRTEFLPLIHRMVNDNINLFVTSRQYPEDIQSSFHDSTKIKISAEDEDIRTYIHGKINENPRAYRLVGQGEFRDEIVSNLTDSANGMAAPNCAKLAINIFLWLVKAQRTLTVPEIRQAVTVEPNRYELDESDLPDNATLLDICAGLVTIDENNIRLAHYTVQQYLLENKIIPDDADFSIITTCLTFLSYSVFTHGACTSDVSFRARKELYPFLKYASNKHYLSFHIQSCNEDQSKDLLLKFLENPGSISTFTQACFTLCSGERNYNDYPKDQSPLHIVSSLGHRTIAQLLLKGDTLCPPKGIDALVPTNLLSASPSQIDNQADVSIHDNSGEIALCVAVSKGHQSAVELLQNGADISAQNSYGNTALHMAVFEGHEEVVELLLENGPDTSVQNSYGNTVLHVAAFEGRQEVIELLLQNGANISAQNIDGNTALHVAAFEGQQAMVELLLQNGASISAQNIDGNTALHWAASKGRREVAKLLLQNDADTSIQDRYKGTALHIAAFEGHQEVVELLLQNGADISQKDDNGDTALHMAASKGHREVVERLLQNGADTFVNDNYGSTALQMAASKGHQAVVELLLRIGADVSVHDSDRIRGLHAVAPGGYQAVNEPLLQNGTIGDTLIQNNHESTIPHVEAFQEQQVVVEMLRQSGTDASVQNRAALHVAASQGFKRFVQLLLQHSAISDTMSALYLAMLKGHLEVVKMLLQDINTNDSPIKNTDEVRLAVTQEDRAMIDQLGKSSGQQAIILLKYKYPVSGDRYEGTRSKSFPCYKMFNHR